MSKHIQSGALFFLGYKIESKIKKRKTHTIGGCHYPACLLPAVEATLQGAAGLSFKEEEAEEQGCEKEKKKRMDRYDEMWGGVEGEEEEEGGLSTHKHPPSSQAHGTIHHSPSASRGESATAPIPTAPKIK